MWYDDKFYTYSDFYKSMQKLSCLGEFMNLEIASKQLYRVSNMCYSKLTGQLKYKLNFDKW